MKTVYIEGWKNLKVDGEDTIDRNLRGKEKIREGGILSVEVSSIDTSCAIEDLDSVYLSSEPVTSITFGEASSAIDRAIELAVAALKSTEVARLVISMKGEFIHENYRTDSVEVKCELSYSIVRNEKEIYEYTAAEKLNHGRRYKEVALQKLNTASASYKYPVYLSVFLLIARALKWFSVISLDELSSEERESLNLLRSQCYNNLSFFHISFENYERAVAAATVVLNDDSNNIKALYRRAVGNTHLQNYGLAETDLRLVLKLEPSNRAAKNQLDIVLDKKRSLDNKYAQAMKKFLSLS